MRQRIIDLRIDDVTATYIADALRLQAEYGYQHACDHLRALGVQAKLAQRLLAIRYDRREAQAAQYAEA